MPSMPQTTARGSCVSPQLASNPKLAEVLRQIRRECETSTYSLILVAPQFTITIIFPSFVCFAVSLVSRLSFSFSLFSPFWLRFVTQRLRRIKIAAVSSKSQKLQRQHQFSARQWISLPPPHTRTHTHAMKRPNFHVQTLSWV